MIGQDAVTTARAFDEQIDVSGVILTKLDGDARGGAALSIKAATGKPIKFLGMGESLDKLDEFRPEGLASRILGMGDIVSLVERAQEVIDQEEADKAAVKLLSGASFTFDDFLSQLEQVQKLGPMKEVLGMLPGMNAKLLKQANTDPDRIRHVQAIIQSMTPEERRRPKVLNGSRRARIARGAGRPVQEVNKLVKQFEQMQKLMKRGGRGGMAGFMQQMAR